MQDRHKDISLAITELTALAQIDPGTEKDLEPIMYPGMSRYDIGVLNAYVIKAKQLCPDNPAVQRLDPLEWECWYTQYRALARQLVNCLSVELERCDA